MSARAPASLVVRHLGHRYPGSERLALDDVGFEVAPGERVGLLGPNGAGKSTLMRIVCGFLPIGSAAAEVAVAGLDVRTQSLAVRRTVGYMPELVPLYPELRVREHLAFRARIKLVRATGRDLERVIAATGLGTVADTPIGRLSRGYRQRVGLADALLGTPPLVVLDEPTVGLDPNQVREIRAMLRELGGRQTLVFSSHILAEVEALCDRVVILAAGKVVLDARLDQALAARSVVVELAGDADAAAAVIAAARTQLGWSEQRVGLEIASAADGVRCTLELADGTGDDVIALRHAIGAAAARAGAEIRALVPGRTQLEQRFAAVTGGREDVGHG